MESPDSANFGQDPLLTQPNHESYQKYMHPVLGMQNIHIRKFPVKQMISKIPRLPSITIENKVEPLSCLNHYQQINRHHSGRRRHEDVFRSSKTDEQMSQESSLKKSKHDKLSFSTNRVGSPVHLSPLQSTQVQPVPVFSSEPPEARPRRQWSRQIRKSAQNTRKLKGIQIYEGQSNLPLVLQTMREKSYLGFVYLSPAVPKSSVNYYYYNLK